MSDPLSILRAQVEAATQGPLTIETDSDGLSDIRSSDYDDGSGVGPVAVHCASYLTKADAELFVTAVAIVRRMVSDEGIEACARALFEAQNPPESGHYAGWMDLAWHNRENRKDLMRAALSSLLTGGA